MGKIKIENRKIMLRNWENIIYLGLLSKWVERSLSYRETDDHVSYFRSLSIILPSKMDIIGSYKHTVKTIRSCNFVSLNFLF